MNADLNPGGETAEIAGEADVVSARRTPKPPSFVRRAAGALVATAWVLATASAVPAAAEDLVVVVSRDMPVERITFEDVGRIYRGELRVLAGTRTAPLDYGPQVTFRDRFLQRAMGTDAPRFSAYWTREIYRIGRVPPQTAASPADALARVAERPGTVAYVRPSDTAGPAGERVRVVLELPCPKTRSNDRPEDGEDHAGHTADTLGEVVTPTPTATRG